jgi:hypothetical protein
MKLNRYFYKEGIQTAKKQCKSMVAHTCNPRYSRRQGSGESQFKASPGQSSSGDPIWKKRPQKRDGRVEQAVGVPA